MDAIKEFFYYLYLYYLELAPYLLLGLILVGVAHIIIPTDKIYNHLSHGKYGWIKAALFGVPLPLCSCGVIPLARFLKQKGASNGSINSFLLSTPTTGIDSIFIYYSILGLPAAIIRPISSLIIGMIGGLFFDQLKDTNKKIHSIPPTAEEEENISNLSLKQKFLSFYHFVFVQFLDDISVRYILGIFIGSIIAFGIPDPFFDSILFNSQLSSYLIMIAIGLPMYLCSAAAVPITIAFIGKGISIGSGFVFLTAAPIMSISSIIMLQTIFSKKFIFYQILYVFFISILLGYSVDYLYVLLDLKVNPIQFNDSSETSFFILSTSIILTFFLLLSLYRVIIKSLFNNHSHH